MAIRIDFLSNTRAVTRDAATLGDTFEKVADALDDVATHAHKSGAKISSEYTEAGRDGERAAERLEKSFKEASDKTAASSKQGAEKLSSNLEHSTRETSEAVKTVKEETLANASETFSSFDGSAQSFADGIQGIFGGVVADLGPIGAAAGAAGALGIGLISSAMANGQEQSEAFKQDVSDLADDLVTTGSRGQASLAKVVSVLQDLATGQDSAGNSLGKLHEMAHDTGISYKDLAQAYAGNGHGLATLLVSQKKHLAALEAQRVAQNDVTGGINRAPSAISKQIEAQQKLISTLEQQRKKQVAAAKDQKDYIESGAEALDRQAQAAQSYADNVQSAYAQAGADISDYVKNGKFDLNAYQKAMEANAAAIVNYQANMATATAQLGKDGHDKAITYLESLGPDAAPLIAAFIKAPAAQQKSLEATWDTLGGAASSSFNSGLQQGLNAVQPSVAVRVYADMSDVDKKINGLKNSQVLIPFGIAPNPGLGVRVP